MDMDADSSPLLTRLIDHANPPAPGRDDLKTALQRLNIHSVFDIVRLSEKQFARQLAAYNDDDAQSIYLRSQSAVAQLEGVFRENQVGSDASSLRHKRRIGAAKSAAGATYKALFEENWDQFCASTSIAAVDSPAAYLRELYLFAEQLEKNALGPSATKLTERRPDLKGLLIDSRSVSEQQPMLSIINHTLLSNIADTPTTDTYALLSDTWYPYSLPFNVYHYTCHYALSGAKPALGELSYRISRKLPIAGNSSVYGLVTAPNDEVQCLLSGLSPEQQNMLKSPLAHTHGAADFYRTYYNADVGAPEKIADFLQHTQLDAEQLQALLAQQAHQPSKSPNCLQDTGLTYGACYVNAPGHSPISLDAQAPDKLSNVSLERFDRLQRMVRLQRWLDIPFAHLDTLIVSVMRGENSTNSTLLMINHNTLRALGVYRYLNKRYGLHAEEFAALVHQMPVHGSGQDLSLFDQVFNRTDSPPLRLDNRPFDMNTRQQLSAALGLQDTPDSLGLLISTNTFAERNILTLSKIYRQARIARLFGLSVLECQQLANLLQLQPQLLNPNLRAAPQGLPDFLDLLMQLDWASQWLKAQGTGPSWLRRQWLQGLASTDSAVNALLKRFADYDQNALTDRVNKLTLAQQPYDETPRLTAINWQSIIHSAMSRARFTGTVEQALDEALGTCPISVQHDRQKHFIEQAKEKLLPELVKTIGELWELYLRLRPLINAQPHPAGESELRLKYECHSALSRLYMPLTPSAAPLQTLGYLILLLPNATELLQLSISQQALHQFLAKPHWLDQAYPTFSLLELSLNTLYLLQRFKHCIDRYNLSEQQLFDYFDYANRPPNDVSLTSRHETDEHLAQLLGWRTEEIEVLSHHLSPPRITSMSRLDWVLRCHQASLDTQLSAGMLLRACQLQSTSTLEEWKVVSEALARTDQ
ncbi:Tc toxin subunit A [Pseudomonas sp. H2_E05]